MPRARSILVRFVLAPAVLAALAAGIAGGLLRAGVALPAGGAWLGAAVSAHAFLVICAFMGTVIGAERAVAVKRWPAWLPPLASGAAGLVLLAGRPAGAAWLAVGASLGFVGVNLVVLGRQAALHTALLLAAALAWAAGCLLHALAVLPGAVVPLWFCFLTLTIAAERLEMTRLMRRRQAAAPALAGILAAMVLGAALSGVQGGLGGLLYGLSLAALAAWLLAFDIARRTLRAQGLSRYMAVCLLLGYAWLFAAGLAWGGAALGLPLRDAALHALALGFVFSMMLGHAPVILPAVARVKLRFGRAFYLPLALLQASLALRLLGGGVDARLLAAGALGNAAAIAAFALTVAGAALAWRFGRAAPRPAPAENDT
ncbi:MAG: hypothetical protein QM788_12505 [Roseateles sp.]|uniref:hypothetical protein n=1 Tax=Roseateles sp. TaxID=1971397 RepID=UPI0039ECFAD5